MTKSTITSKNKPAKVQNIQYLVDYFVTNLLALNIHELQKIKNSKNANPESIPEAMKWWRALESNEDLKLIVIEIKKRIIESISSKKNFNGVFNATSVRLPFMP